MTNAMNIAFPRALDAPPARRSFTAADVWRMVDAGVISENEKLELVEGDFIMMAAKG